MNQKKKSHELFIQGLNYFLKKFMSYSGRGPFLKWKNGKVHELKLYFIISS